MNIQSQTNIINNQSYTPRWFIKDREQELQIRQNYVVQKQKNKEKKKKFYLVLFNIFLVIIEITSYFNLVDKGISEVGKGEVLPEYEPLVCEDEFALCDFEKEKICSACSCLVAINTNDGGEQVDEADRFKFQFITVVEFSPQGINVTVARETILSSDTCLVCVDDRSTADCVSGVLGGVTVDCCADLLGENTKEYEEESDTIEESEESASSLNAIRHNKY